MGLIILPFLIVILFVFIKAINRIRIFHIARKLTNEDFKFGFITAIIFFLLIILTLFAQKKVSPFAPYFIFPFFMIFIPYFFAISTFDSRNIKLQIASKRVLTSILFSGIIIIILFTSEIDLFKILNLEKVY